MSLRKQVIFIIFSWFTFLFANANEGSNLALRMILSKKVWKGLSVQVEEDLRTTSDFHTVHWLMTIAEVNYQFHPMLIGGVGYTNLANFLDAEELSRVQAFRSGELFARFGCCI